MKRTATILVFSFLSILVKAQVSFKTIIPELPVVAGESFRVQYIIEDAADAENFKPPVFEHFRLVTGPEIYTGNIPSLYATRTVRNHIYTLVANRPGKFIIRGASVQVNGKTIKSNDALLTVVSQKDAELLLKREKEKNQSDYFLRPGEDPYAKIKKNLFLKVMVDKKSCYTGEPVLATFKLYSSLESRSDIIKNPGFYGFTVFDMVNLTDKEVKAEKVNGKLFDVHTIRKVQLYPLQAGRFVIDPMEVKNKVEFSRSAVNKKTEQEIIEGMFGQESDEPEKENTVSYETNMTTEEIAIEVKPLPASLKPENYNGATGRFTIDAKLINDNPAKNEEAMLEVTISGKGNFIQLTAPVISWPNGIDFFEPSLKDELDRTLMPLNGSRTFRFPFVCTRLGKQEIPSIRFSFFDTDSNSYKTISTAPIAFEVKEERKINRVSVKEGSNLAEANRNASRIAGGIVIGIVLIVLTYWILIKKKAKEEVETEKSIFYDADEILLAAREAVAEKKFYTELSASLWKYLSTRFHLEGSSVNKDGLFVKMKRSGIPGEIINKLENTLNQCEAGQYTNANLSDDREIILQHAKEVIGAIESNHSEYL